MLNTLRGDGFDWPLQVCCALMFVSLLHTQLGPGEIREIRSPGGLEP